MSNNVKLYKCSKGTCSKCLDEENPYITEDEYKELIDLDGKVKCPEGHLDCGIKEVSPEDLPKPKTAINKKIVFIVSGVLLAILIGVGSFFMLTNKAKTPEKVDVITQTELSNDTEALNTIENKDNANSNEPAENKTLSESSKVDPINTTPTIAAGNTENGAQISATTLEDHFSKLSNPNIPYSNKNGIKKSIQKFFAPDAQIVEVNNLGQALVAGKTVLDYAEHLCSNTKSVIIKDKVMRGGKIAVLKIKEE